MHTSISSIADNLSEALTGTDGLQRIQSAYDSLSWLLDNNNRDNIYLDGIAYILELLNSQMKHQIERLSMLESELHHLTNGGAE